MEIIIRQFVLISILILLFSSNAIASEKLIFALDVVRHGDRAPFDGLPTAPYIWNEGEGQLTALGMQHEYELGLKLHQRYMIDLALLPTKYQPNTIYVRSTDFDRTIMSAQSLLLGLYPLGSGPSDHHSTPALPSGFQPVPIHTVPMSQDSAYLIDIGSEEMDVVLNKYVYSGSEWLAKSAEFEKSYTNWSHATGVKIQNMFDLLYLSDTVLAYVNHHIPLPKNLSKADADKIISAGDWIFGALFKPNEVGDVAGKPALNKIARYLKNAASGKSKVKLVIISAHDVTVLAIMSALHAPLTGSPGFAPDLHFGLYDTGFGNYIVKVTFNDKPVIIPGCNQNNCPLSFFEERH